jgi:subfamily B ATP-binding cassette protein HlyB/CyaB
MGARNQAFVTEHIAGFETVKSLQMEPQLRQRWAGYLAAYLQSSFATKQIGNTYSVAASTLDQLQTLLVLMLGAYIVMTEPNFTIGMLVAFQMFAGKLSQPVQRLVGLWSQFQQARLAVLRLGDVMNAPAEPYSLQPRRLGQVHQASRIELADVSFQYTPERPTLYRHGAIGQRQINPGQAAAGFLPANGRRHPGGRHRHPQPQRQRIAGPVWRGAARDHSVFRNDLGQPDGSQPRGHFRAGGPGLQDERHPSSH